MKIEIIRGTVVGGKPARVGQVVSADPKEANALVSMGKAILYQNNRAIGLDTEEPEVVTRKVRKGRPPKQAN